MHQQSERPICGSQIVEQLGSRDGLEDFAGLDLDDQPAVDDEVCAISTHRNTSVKKLIAELPRNRYSNEL